MIANPPCIGHIHVCEALGIPLHIMFPQPWYYGTKSFPHPMSGLGYQEYPLSINSKSYYAFETVMWTNFGSDINKWRSRTLGLPPIPLVLNFANPIKSSNIPFSAMWSPSFVPKPNDWPKQVRVVGTFTQDKKSSTGGVDITKFGTLIDWLNVNNGNGDNDNDDESSDTNKPVFIGFGSMVINDTERLSNIIIDAARTTKTRIIVQSSWSKIDVTSEPILCHGVGPVAHDWLLPQCRAVIHHGTYLI